jgi:chromate transporter
MIWKFFLHTLAIGSLTFGGGYAMISALQQDFVVQNKWLSSTEFSNGVAVGQITPGPLMVMISFMGYKVAGLWGAVLGTIGLFIPSFLVVILLSSYFNKIKSNVIIQSALKGINAAVIGLSAAATIDLGISSFKNPATVIISLLTGLLLFRFSKIEPAWILIGAGIVGLIFLR